MSAANNLKVISKDEWFNEYHKRLFKDRESAIIYFGNPNFDNVEVEITEYLNQLDDPVFLKLYLPEGEFKFLKRKCRKYFDLNRLPEIITVCDNDFLSYLHIANYNKTHPGTIVPCVESLLEELHEAIDEQEEL